MCVITQVYVWVFAQCERAWFFVCVRVHVYMCICVYLCVYTSACVSVGVLGKSTHSVQMRVQLLLRYRQQP